MAISAPQPLEEVEPAMLGTKYTGQPILDATKEYLAKCEIQIHKLPTIEGLSVSLGVLPCTVDQWARIHPKFRTLKERVLAMQKDKLIDWGLAGGKGINSTMAIFLLKCNHGLIESNRNLIGNADGSNIDSINIYKPIKNKE